jgi:hypothetical protein
MRPGEAGFRRQSGIERSVKSEGVSLSMESVAFVVVRWASGMVEAWASGAGSAITVRYGCSMAQDRIGAP